jgi:hypothetical protein
MGTRRKKKVSKSLRTCEYPWPGSLGRKNPLDFSPILASFFFLSAKADKTGVTGFLSSCRFVLPRALVLFLLHKNRTSGTLTPQGRFIYDKSIAGELEFVMFLMKHQFPLGITQHAACDP